MKLLNHIHARYRLYRMRHEVNYYLLEYLVVIFVLLAIAMIGWHLGQEPLEVPIKKVYVR